MKHANSTAGLRQEQIRKNIKNEQKPQPSTLLDAYSIQRKLLATYLSPKKEN